jgi:hypothetical protein
MGGGEIVSRQALRCLIAVCICAALLQGCSRTRAVYNVENHPFPAAAQSLTAADIEKSIITAGAVRGWRFEPVKPGQLRGTIERKHRAVVDVYYTQATYSIVLNSSDNLSQSSGEIPRNYDNWIRNLENDIEAQLKVASINRT